MVGVGHDSDSPPTLTLAALLTWHQLPLYSLVDVHIST
ncbi:hypothetical protein COLO4_17922 [Corchorus olitorius]|uniref:Uncharacterized protein n=1 Tax=Corchorus olitorius TaxID=93759 RepID=A0A1R3JB34_9ROSI|nr:hypothetical protein COLO4_17922 [Corchorus olitorius]